MNKTTNYNLNQWEAGDRVLRTDFNSDNAKLDAAIKAVDQKADGKAAQSALNALQTVVNGKGNCNVYVGTYTGEGTSIRTLTFPAGFQPKVVIVAGFYSAVFVRGAAQTAVTGAGTSTGARLSVTWEETKISWQSTPGNAGISMNSEESLYAYVMLG